MSSFPVARASPAQEKSEPCQVNHADEMGNRSGENKSGRTLRSAAKKGVSVERDTGVADDLNRCLYCSREFVGSYGLGRHLKYCKNKLIFNVPECQVVLEDVCPQGEGTDKSFSLDSLNRLSSTDHSVENFNSGSVLASQENLHRAKFHDNRESEAKVLSRLPQRTAIRWPRMGDLARWREFEDQVASDIPEHWLSVTKKINLLETVVCDVAQKLFGVVERKSKKSSLSRRQVEIIRCRSNLNDLQKAWLRSSNEEEKAGIALFQDDCKSRLRLLRKAELSRKRRWKRKTTRSRFFKDPFGVAREVLTPRVVSEPDVSKEKLNAYVRTVGSDSLRDVPLGPLEGLPDFRADIKAFDDRPFTFWSFQRVLKRKRNASKPGPNQIPYKVYKKCPKLANIIFKLMQIVRKSGHVPLKWRIADGIFIPKVVIPNKEEIPDYRQIALMNVEGKLFWSLVSGKFYDHLVTTNKIIDTSCQKGSIQKMAGVWEHTSMMWSGMQDARKRRKSLVVLWLDLANAYGSVPHKLIEFALRRYGIPDKWVGLILSYYDGLWSRSCASDVYSDWFRYEVGIFAGCTVSVILFLAAFNVCLEFVSQLSVPRYRLENGNPLPLLRGFMDDLNVMTISVRHGALVLDAVDKVLTWCRMKAKAVKSRSCVIKTGRCLDISPFQVGGDVIPSLQQNPVKSLGRIIDGSLSDRKSKDELFSKALDGLKTIDKSMLSGVMKLFTYQNILLQRLCWPLMIYEIPLSWVEVLESKINVFLRKWLGVHRSLSNVALFCKDSPFPLPISSISVEFKKRMAGALIQLQESVDPTVSENVPELYTGRKWKVAEAVKSAGGDVRVNQIQGFTQRNTQGLGFRKGWNKELASPFRKQVTSEIGKQESQKLYAKAVQQSLQGKWTRWESIVSRDMSFNNMLRASPKMISFTLGVTFDTVGSPSNLKRWGLADSDSCALCDKPKCTVGHILAGCKVSLASGRFRFRHDSVLKVIAHHILLASKNSFRPRQKIPVNFVSEGSSVKNISKKARLPEGILSQASDWVLLADVGKALIFPTHIHVTSLRPDLVVYSNSLRYLIIIELTCPMEENLAYWNSEKTIKYTDLVRACRKAGWTVFFFAVEVGARGYACVSLRQCLSKLGFFGSKLRNVMDEAAAASSRASFWIWVKRDEEWQGASHSKKLNTKPCFRAPRSSGRTIQSPKPCFENSIPVSGRAMLPRGLNNVGNTCFINASLQAIKFVWNGLKFDESLTVSNTLSRTIADLSGAFSKAMYPLAFVSEARRSVMSRKANSFEDAHEFLLKLCAAIKCRSFDMLIVYHSECFSCGHFTLQDDQVFGLTCALKNTVEECLSSMFDRHVEEWLCAECAQRTKVTKTSSLLENPDVLVIHLERFTFSANRVKKLSNSVTFPLTNLVLHGHSHNLVAVINHIGSCSSGHYTASVLENNQWFSIDDAISSSIDSRSVCTNNAYLLFYQKVH